jgi:lipopolysaccharide export system protein LptA
MALERLFTHRLIKTLQIALPVVVLVLIAIPAINYRYRQRLPGGLPYKIPSLPKDLTLRTDNFNFSKIEGDRTLFTIHAKTNLGTSDNKNMLEDVDVTVFGDKPNEPPKRLTGKTCSYEQKSEDIVCSGNVEVRLDEQTTARTEQLFYSHSERRIVIRTHVTVERPGTASGESDALEYDLTSALLKVVGNVRLRTSTGMNLEAASAVFDQRQNRATADGGVLLRSKNGWARGARARVELMPQTLQPRSVFIEGSASSEMVMAKTGETLKVTAESLDAQMTDNNVVKQVVARNNVELRKAANDGTIVMTGGEMIAHMDQAGQVELVETKNKAIMNFGDDRSLRAATIWTDTSGGISTSGESELQVGASRVRGSSFLMQNGDVVKFNTAHPAVMTLEGRELSGDVTEASFDNKTNQLVSLTQTGHFSFKQDDRQGAGAVGRFQDGGHIVTLEGSARTPAWVSDARSRVEGELIRLDDNTKTLVAERNVKSVSSDSGDRVLVTAGSLRQSGELITYDGRVRFYRGEVSIESDHLEAPVAAKAAKVTATGHVFSTVNNMRAWADRLDYDDQTRVAHYTGNVKAQKQDMRISGAAMNVSSREAADKSVAVSQIVAIGQVVLTRSTSRASGEQAVYTAETQQVVLTGPKAQVTNGQGSMTTGPRIVINVAGDKMAVVESAGSEKPVTTLKVKQ